MVYVLNKNGTPLMPTNRHGKVRRLLKNGLAKVVKAKPFTIQLLYETGNYVQPLHGGTDTGRTNIGNAVVSDNGKAVYADSVESRNKEIVGLMTKRKTHRQGSRRGNRKVRQRRAVKTDPDLSDKRIPKFLAKKKGPVTHKIIKGKESRFNNRRRPIGWKTPSVNQCIQTHLNQIKNICKIVPVKDWSIECPKFAFMRMEDGTVKGTDFQNGRLKGYASVNDYVYTRQDGKSYFSNAPIEHYHHVIWRSRGGSDGPENIIGVTKKEHALIHEGKLKVDVDGFRKKYKGASVLNSAMWDIYTELVQLFGEDNVHIVYGYETAKYRKDHKIKKTHTNDAYCISCLGAGLKAETPPTEIYKVKQYRRHNRKINQKQTERAYKLNGKTVCKNRHKRTGQTKDDSLAEFRYKHPTDVGKLKVIKSKISHQNPERHLPGMVFMYEGKRYVLRGSQHNEYQYYPEGLPAKEYFLASKCHILECNRGLVYL